MIKVYASIASVGFLVLAGSAGCSSASTPDDGDGGTSSSTAGTGTNTAGTSVVPPGGSSQGGSGSNPTAGSGSTPTAGTGSTPTAGTGSGGTGAANPVACKSIKTGMACMPEGQDCPDLKCGLADSGTRSCLCQTTWMCAACDFSASPFKDKPADITTCTNQADKLDCAGMEGAVCEGAAGGEVCACWPDDEGSLIWDCDKPPSTWAAAAAN